MFTQQDIMQIENHGLSVPQAERQLAQFRAGFPALPVVRAATPGDGIVRLDPARAGSYAENYRSRRSGRRIVKFVPASGAATRMFRDLFRYLDDGDLGDAVRKVLAHIGDFAFSAELLSGTGGSDDPRRLISGIVSDPLGYGSLPKALILFHAYAEAPRTALEEHLAEGAMYAAGAGNEVHLHLTVSPEHRSRFERLVSRVLPVYEARYGVRFRIGYSRQEPSTDTLAVNPDNTPFRDDEGRLLLRPAGHGALIGNLNGLDADLVFIKTVDNVQPDRLKADTVMYKEVLGGVLLELQRRSFRYLEELEAGDREHLDEIARFVSDSLCRRLPTDFGTRPAEERADRLRDLLNRPLRVCGMVRNEGEPGGGPFWVAEADGGESLQIAESSQIAPEDKGLMTAATHFNPVDLVCGLRDYRGGKFDLLRFVDPQTGFISSKTHQGRPLRALELPGLWNGAMARWNTVFVEVPISTFSPVKTIDDLLRPEHRGA